MSIFTGYMFLNYCVMNSWYKINIKWFFLRFLSWLVLSCNIWIMNVYEEFQNNTCEMPIWKKNLNLIVHKTCSMILVMWCILMIFHSPVCVFIDMSQMMHKCFFVCKKPVLSPKPSIMISMKSFKLYVMLPRYHTVF